MLSVPEMNKSLSRESIVTGGAEGQRISIFLHPDGPDQARMMWRLQLDLFFGGIISATFSLSLSLSL